MIDKWLKKKFEKFFEGIKDWEVCYDCGHLIQKNKAYTLKIRYREYKYMPKDWDGQDRIYCSKCAPPYDEIFDNKYLKNKVEVDKKGKTINKK